MEEGTSKLDARRPSRLFRGPFRPLGAAKDLPTERLETASQSELLESLEALSTLVDHEFDCPFQITSAVGI